MLAPEFDPCFPPEVAFTLIGRDSFSSLSALKLELHPQENKLLNSHASEKRVVDFCLGRSAAHRAISQLLPETDTLSIGQGLKGEPIWPEGIVGSITHADGYAAAAVSKADLIRAIGVDLISLKRKVDPAIARHICLPLERDWVFSHPQQQQQRLLGLFSAKESAFKALYPLCKCFISFFDILFIWEAATNQFRAVLQKDLSSEFSQGYSLLIKLNQQKQHILTSLFIR